MKSRATEASHEQGDWLDSLVWALRCLEIGYVEQAFYRFTEASLRWKWAQESRRP